MSFPETLILGSIAGLTIFLGLPLARLRVVAPKHSAFLNATAIGILFFLFVDIVEHAIAPVEAAIKSDPIIYPPTSELTPLETRKATPAGQRARDQIFAEFKAA